MQKTYETLATQLLAFSVQWKGTNRGRWADIQLSRLRRGNGESMGTRFNLEKHERQVILEWLQSIADELANSDLVRDWAQTRLIELYDERCHDEEAWRAIVARMPRLAAINWN